MRFLTKIFGVGFSLPVLGILLGASLLAPRTARANSGSSFFETIGISIAVGTVLGASTLPFYDQPGKHLDSMAYGAGAGAVAGVGILIYGLFRGTSDDSEASLTREAVLADMQGAGLNSKRRSGPQALTSRTSELRRVSLASFSAPKPIPASVWIPVVSLTW